MIQLHFAAHNLEVFFDGPCKQWWFWKYACPQGELSGQSSLGSFQVLHGLETSTFLAGRGLMPYENVRTHQVVGWCRTIPTGDRNYLVPGNWYQVLCTGKQLPGTSYQPVQWSPPTCMGKMLCSIPGYKYIFNYDCFIASHLQVYPCICCCVVVKQFSVCLPVIILFVSITVDSRLWSAHLLASSASFSFSCPPKHAFLRRCPWRRQ